MKNRNWLLIILVCFILFISAGLFLSGLVMILVGSDMIPQSGNVAVVKLEGEIADSAPFVKNVEDLEDREDIKAVVVRIDSPGGLVAPSQEMYRALTRLRKKKKVVASMGTFGTSGAYYVAMGADKIVANQGTITGSIGVRIDHVNIEELVALARLKPQVLTTGPYKDMGSPLRPLRPDEEKLFRDIIFQMYSQFKQVVAKERKMSMEEVDQVADGRIFTGIEALKKGLIDSLGSLQDAIDVAAKMAGIEGKPEVIYPGSHHEHWLRYFVKECFSFVRLMMMETPRQPVLMWHL